MKRMLTTVAHLAPLVRTGLVGGLAVAALTFPVAALAGLTLKSGTDAFDSLPKQLLIVPSPQTSYVYAADGKTLLTSFYEEDRKYIPIGQMSPLVQRAIIAAETPASTSNTGANRKARARRSSPTSRPAAGPRAPRPRRTEEHTSEPPAPCHP